MKFPWVMRCDMETVDDGQPLGVQIERNRLHRNTVTRVQAHGIERYERKEIGIS